MSYIVSLINKYSLNYSCRGQCQFFFHQLQFFALMKRLREYNFIIALIRYSVLHKDFRGHERSDNMGVHIPILFFTRSLEGRDVVS